MSHFLRSIIFQIEDCSIPQFYLSPSVVLVCMIDLSDVKPCAKAKESGR